MGYDAGKQVNGRKIHALVDSEGLPMRVVLRSAAIQDRDAAGLVLDKIRRRFPWLELIWTDGGYNAWQVDAAVARVPLLRYGDRQAERRDEGFCRAAASLGCRAHFLLVRTQPASRQGLRKSYRNPGHLRSLASIQLALRRLARA